MILSMYINAANHIAKVYTKIYCKVITEKFNDRKD